MFCIGCCHQTSFKPFSRATLCSDCWLAINKLRTLDTSWIPGPAHCSDPRGFPLVSLYRYESLIREIILAAKVKSDLVCLDYICAEFRRIVAQHPLLSSADFIAVAPSSLWSRLRLRFNIAQQLAVEWQKLVRTPEIRLPYSYYFEFQKRAKRHDKRWTVDDLPLIDLTKTEKFRHLRHKTLVIIDDIATSGLTLGRIAGQFREVDIKLMVFASPYRS
jgi:predicted amidophosphoribosyltransferase